MNPAKQINQTSGDVEYYTPSAIVDAARRVMGCIDLDPASSAKANERVGARGIFTVNDDGLSRPWTGRVWMNHPFGKVQNPVWIQKLCREVETGGGNCGLLHNLRLHIRALVSASFVAPTVLPLPAHKLLSAGWHAKNGRHEGQRSNLLWRRFTCICS